VFNRTKLSLALGFVFAVSALGVMAAPAAAEVIVKQCVGTCGYYEVYDNDTTKQGVTCTYGTSYPYGLKTMTVRPPLMHGYHSTKTKVGWRFTVQRKKVGGSSWSVFYQSGYQTAQASDSIPAYQGHGFTKRSYSLANPNGYYWRVHIELQWYGSPQGYAKVRYTWYLAVRGNTQNVDMDYCLQAF